MNQAGFDGFGFLGLYLSAGVITSFGSAVLSALLRRGQHSVGASGAVLTIATIVAFAFPEGTEFSLIFLPMVTFPATTMIYGIACLDVCGLILKWRLFDHACHLSAVALGFWYVNLGGHEVSQRLQRWAATKVPKMVEKFTKG